MYRAPMTNMSLGWTTSAPIYPMLPDPHRDNIVKPVLETEGGDLIQATLNSTPLE